MSQPYESIEHVVVLMQENRSFDNMLGWQFGLSGSLFNRSDDGTPIHVWPGCTSITSIPSIASHGTSRTAACNRIHSSRRVTSRTPTSS